MIRKVPLLTSQCPFYCRENLSLSFPERAFHRQAVFHVPLPCYAMGNLKKEGVLMTRTKLRNRSLPNYSLGEELLNAISHGIGALLAIAGTVLCLIVAEDTYGAVSSCIFGLGLIGVCTISCVYHSLRPGMAKKVLQVVDHCTIYLLIAGTYTVVVLTAIRPVYPVLGWGLFFFQWAMAALAVTLTAIDLKKYNVFSMICYIGMGWAVIPFWRQALDVLTKPGFLLLLSGGIAYTIGSILYGIGVRRKWMHGIFHLFVLLGAALQYACVLLYVL